MTGSILNAAGIFIGGLLGLLLSRQFSHQSQMAWRYVMGLLTVIIGLNLTWMSLNGPFRHFCKEIAIMMMAMTLGRFTGRLLHIQSGMNRLGQFASQRFAAARPDDPNRANEGFLICTLLFCAGPLGPIGAVQDGLNGYWFPLAVKMVMDGLAAMGFVTIYGWGVLLSAIPVLVFEGSTTLGARCTQQALFANHLLDSVNAVAGMLIFCVALIILELKKFELGDYLPSLVMAPVVTWLWQ